ncbi:hypothetical protein D3C85_1716940 [compost metagenome]
MTDSVEPTIETAAAPSLLTKNKLAQTKTDSITSSKTIGTASNTIARLILPEVNFFSRPNTAVTNKSV